MGTRLLREGGGVDGCPSDSNWCLAPAAIVYGGSVVYLLYRWVKKIIHRRYFDHVVGRTRSLHHNNSKSYYKYGTNENHPEKFTQYEADFDIKYDDLGKVLSGHARIRKYSYTRAIAMVSENKKATAERTPCIMGL